MAPFGVLVEDEKKKKMKSPPSGDPVSDPDAGHHNGSSLFFSPKYRGSL